MESAMSEYKLDPMHDFCNSENGKLLSNRISEMDILQRVEIASLCQMFSFWREIQETLFAAAEEIKRLRARVNELEGANGKADKGS
jgi:hypothetical protein